MNLDDIFQKLKNRQPSILGKEKSKQYAVLLPLVNTNNETHILFEVRSMKMRSQPGDVCFPGGRMDEEDLDEQYCAIRETSEELGINSTFIRDVTPLDYIASEYGSIIYPFVGKITTLESMELNKDEVEEVFTVPLSYFLQTKPEKYKVDIQIVPERNFPFDLIHGGEDYNWRTRQMDEHFYKYEDRVIWGLTAKIITHFIRLLKTNEIKVR